MVLPDRSVGPSLDPYSALARGKDAPSFRIFEGGLLSRLGDNDSRLVFSYLRFARGIASWY